MKNKPNNNKVH